MKKYRAKLQGQFEVTQDCTADSEQEAIEKFKSNLGDDVESTALTELEILTIEEVE